MVGEALEGNGVELVEVGLGGMSEVGCGVGEVGCDVGSD